MNLPLKFLNQQILTSVGLLSVLAMIVDAYVTGTWGMMIGSLVYSNIIVSLVCSQIILHRYFSHRCFAVNVLVHKTLCIISVLPGQGSPIAWAAAHRHHHKHSDTELDNHSPKESYFLAMGGWLLKGYDWVVTKKKLRTIPTDLLRDKFVVKIDTYYYYIWYCLIIVSAAISYKFLLYFILAPIGTALIIASLVTLGCHIKLPGSYRSFDTADDTHNNMYVQWLVLGDALHNNHHCDPTKWDLKMKKNEIDIAGIIINVIRKN